MPTQSEVTQNHPMHQNLGDLFTPEEARWLLVVLERVFQEDGEPIEELCAEFSSTMPDTDGTLAKRIRIAVEAANILGGLAK